jgi:hypothetical protein
MAPLKHMERFCELVVLVIIEVLVVSVVEFVEQKLR